MRRALVIALLLVVAAALAWFYWPRTATRTYTVQRGDTLALIAKREGVTVDQLVAWNDIDNPNAIEVGQRLTLQGDQAPAPTRHRNRRVTHAAPEQPPASTLRMPAPQPCLPPPSDADAIGDEAGFAVSQGLSEAQVREAMRAFLPQLTSCLDDDSRGVLKASIRVGCDGRVTGARVLSADHVSDAAAACIVDRLRYAPFPAHALPDGDEFQYRFDLSL